MSGAAITSEVTEGGPLTGITGAVIYENPDAVGSTETEPGAHQRPTAGADGTRHNADPLVGEVPVEKHLSSVNREWLADANPVIIADTRYAVYVEYGTKFMDAQPYMRPALRYAAARAPQYAVQADSAERFAELVAEDAKEYAKSIVPVDTGYLRSQIDVADTSGDEFSSAVITNGHTTDFGDDNEGESDGDGSDGSGGDGSGSGAGSDSSSYSGMEIEAEIVIETVDESDIEQSESAAGNTLDTSDTNVDTDDQSDLEATLKSDGSGTQGESGTGTTLSERLYAASDVAQMLAGGATVVGAVGSITAIETATGSLAALSSGAANAAVAGAVAGVAAQTIQPPEQKPKKKRQQGGSQ